MSGPVIPAMTSENILNAKPEGSGNRGRHGLGMMEWTNDVKSLGERKQTNPADSS
jgi:hypothetical protein